MCPYHPGCGHNLLFRACFGTPAQIWSRDEHYKRDLTTEFMFFALLRKGVNEELPSWPEVVVVFDGQDGSAQRKEADAGYKANRPADSETLKPIRALPSVKAGLDLFAITRVEIDDAEADDVIATLAASCPERDVLIASAGRGHIGQHPRRPRYRHKTAAALLDGGLTLDDLPASGRLASRKGAAITSAWQQVLTWRDMIRMNNQVPVPPEPSAAWRPRRCPALLK